MRLATAALAFIALLAAGVARDASAIVRCESADGKVTYSNSDCPPNTKLVRKIEPSPPVVVHDNARPAAKAGEARPPAKVEPSRARRTEDPVQIDEELNAQLAEQRRECEARTRELQRLQDDVNAALPANRASAELALRRAQDEYRALCPRQR
jgi:uncharacterized coiled-coil protein SlyX